MTDDEIVAIRDKHLGSQGEEFDCIAFARAVLAAQRSNADQEEYQARLALKHAPHAVSAEADFDKMTWTFEITSECRVASGTYALVRLDAWPNASNQPAP